MDRSLAVRLEFAYVLGGVPQTEVGAPASSSSSVLRSLSTPYVIGMGGAMLSRRTVAETLQHAGGDSARLVQPVVAGKAVFSGLELASPMAPTGTVAGGACDGKTHPHPSPPLPPSLPCFVSLHPPP